MRRETKRFYDFSSGIGGNVFTFVKFYFRCSSEEAIEILKKYAGYNGQIMTRKKMAATLICKRFQQKNRSLKPVSPVTIPDDCMERYEKRADKLAIWEQEGISGESLDRFQVCYDSFSNRLVYPIRNIDGKIVNIGGRTLDPLWKEKGQRKYTYFYPWGGSMGVIYGLYENLEFIQQSKEVIVFEGCKSVLLADSWGIRNCVAILTSHVNPQQMKLFAQLGYTVVFALDKDVRIRDDHNISKLKRYVKVFYLWDREDLLSAKDAPVDKGEEVFRRLYEERLRYK